MPSFFSSTSPKKPTPVFAGLDDPFNFPASKMRYNLNSRSRSRTSSPDSATDSGYGSIDEDCPLSPKSNVSPKNRRQLRKNKDGQWITQNYEPQSEHNNHNAERQPILQAESRREADTEHEWKPNLQHTFTLICADARAKPKWYTTRVYGRKMLEKEKNEGVTHLQRSLAPTIRRACPAPSPACRPLVAPRKKSSLLHPSPPPPAPLCSSTKTDGMVVASRQRGRDGEVNSVLHPTHPLLHSRCDYSSMHHSPPPLRTLSRKPSVLHSCFSDTDTDASSDAVCDGADEDEEEDEDEDIDVCSRSCVESDSRSRRVARERNGVVLARTGFVVRAQRVRVRRGGVNKMSE